MRIKGQTALEWLLSRSPIEGFLILILSGNVLAGETPSTEPVQGRAPVVVAPSNRAVHAVDFDWTGSDNRQLSVGDTITLKYFFVDPDGDDDATHATVTWSYIKPDDTLERIPATYITHSPGTETIAGTSVMHIPPEALGAKAIHVELNEVSVTGNPHGERLITVQDTSLLTDAPGPGGGGTNVTPPGPVQIGGHIAGGIFLARDVPGPGKGMLDYARSERQPKVGETYIFRAWADANDNGVWDNNEAEMTTFLGHIQWMLDGNNSSASGGTPSLGLNNKAIAGAITDNYTIPVNNQSDSGAVPGDQGFRLRVDFEK